MNIEDLKMYLVRNIDGQYYKRIGFSGSGKGWVDDVSKASVWTKISPARAIITYFANTYPDYPTPSLIEISAGTITVLDETDRVNKVIAKKKRDADNYELRRKREALDRAQKELDEASARLSYLRGNQ